MNARFVERRLPNGLRVVVEERPSMKSATIGMWVNTGARDETSSLMGVSHFLEHMMFKGTERMSTRDLNLAFDEMGAIVNNASTDFDATTYYAKVVPAASRAALALITHMMRPALRTEDFEMEKNVILEEIALYWDRPVFEVMVQGMIQYFGDHPLSIPILGTPETIRAMSAEAMRGYWAARYTPHNMLLCGVGALRAEEFFDQAAQLCGSWQGPEAKRQFPKVQPNVTGVRVIPKPSFARQHLLFLSPAPPRQPEWEEASGVLTTVLGDSQHSRLYWELIESGLADTAELQDTAFEDVGVYMTYVSCEPSRAAEVARKAMEVIRRPKQFTDDEIEMAKNKIMSGVVLGAERGVGRYYGLGSDLLHGQSYRTIEEEAAAFEKITRQDLERVVEAYPMDQWAVTTIGPLEKLEI